MVILDCVCTGGDLGMTPKGESARHLRFAVIDSPENRAAFGGGPPNGSFSLAAIAGVKVNIEDRGVIVYMTPAEAEQFRAMQRAQEQQQARPAK